MPSPLSGPGLGLPFPQNLYPTELGNAPQDCSSNRVPLAPGDVFVIPAGDWFINLGLYCIIQYLDPVTGIWTAGAGAAWTRGQVFVKGDGFNARVANLTGCVYSASVVVGGTNYVQATTTITAIGSFSNGAAPTLVPIVGGALALTGTFTIDVPTKGAGYGVPPLIMIPPPPPSYANANGVGGIPAQAVAVLGSGGSISSISVINPGAGYPSVPTIAVVTNPFDPNINTGITVASVTMSLTSAGVIMGALVTNNGSPLNNGSLASVTLSIGGAGSSGSLTANVMQTVVAATVTGPGVGFGTAELPFATMGGAPVAGSITNNTEALRLAWLPRQAQIGLTPANTSVSVGSPGTIYDGGLFLSAPSLNILLPANLAAPSTVASVAAVMGSRIDKVDLQAAP
jgi:hypothetical protein